MYHSNIINKKIHINSCNECLRSWMPSGFYLNLLHRIEEHANNIWNKISIFSQIILQKHKPDMNCLVIFENNLHQKFFSVQEEHRTEDHQVK